MQVRGGGAYVSGNQPSVPHLHDAQGVRGSNPLRPTKKAQVRGGL